MTNASIEKFQSINDKRFIVECMNNKKFVLQASEQNVNARAEQFAKSRNSTVKTITEIK